jgi:hypothetical protein
MESMKRAVIAGRFFYRHRLAEARDLSGGPGRRSRRAPGARNGGSGETVEKAGVEPLMVRAIVRRMDWSAQLALREVFGGKTPSSHREFAAKVAALRTADEEVAPR